MAPLELPVEDPRPGLAYPLYETRLHRLIVRVVRWFFGLFMILQVSGLENLPTAGAVVYNGQKSAAGFSRGIRADAKRV